MIDAYLAAMRSYGTFQGRTSRRDYWLYTLCFAVLIFIAFILESIFRIGSEDVRPLMGLLSIAHLTPNVAITSRRLHDLDRSALWMLLWLTGIGAIVTFVFSLLPGTSGANRFGPAPKIGRATDDNENAQSTIAPISRGSIPTFNLTEELERLAQLRANGSLTDAEFNTMKSRLLAKGT